MTRPHSFDVTLHWDDPEGFTRRCWCGWVTPPALDESVLPLSQLEHLMDCDDEPPVVLAGVDLVVIGETLSMAAGALEVDPGPDPDLQRKLLIVSLDTLVGHLARRLAQVVPAVSLPGLLLTELILVATEAAVLLDEVPVTAELGAHLAETAEWLHLAWLQAAEVAVT